MIRTIATAFVLAVVALGAFALAIEGPSQNREDSIGSRRFGLLVGLICTALAVWQWL